MISPDHEAFDTQNSIPFKVELRDLFVSNVDVVQKTRVE